MQLIIIHRNKNRTIGNSNLLRFAISSEPIASLILKALSRGFPQSRVSSLCRGRNSKIMCAIPEEWGIKPCKIYYQPAAFRRAFSGRRAKIISYTEDVPICFELPRRVKRRTWVAFSNGRFATQISEELLDKVLAKTQADVLAVNAQPELLAYHEKVQLAAQNKVAGFRRVYTNSAEPAPLPINWPHYIFIKIEVLDQVLVDNALPESFSAFLQRCQSTALTLRAVNVAGVASDLETEDGLLNFCRTWLSNIRPALAGKTRNSNMISPDSRLAGKVLLGKNVHIGPKAIVIGPTIISDNVKIKKGAVINSSIIGPGVCVPPNQLVQNRVVKGPKCNWKRLNRSTNDFSKQINHMKCDLNHRQHEDTFRNWPRFSYARCFKRIADCFAAIIVLIMFAPIMPFIALAIKLTSPGPAFFKDKRQGLHGKEFCCLKFRSMPVGADKIQDKLRMISQVDGPQFKIKDDPRLTTVGRFLRDTYIDEVPQFFNVLLGQMSVIGPRPSPEVENTLCPFWRDTRLSVRPGITGLWQVCRTRQSMKDFQEWIHYDTEYVKNLSLRTDLWICWQTAKEMVRNLISQF